MIDRLLSLLQTLGVVIILGVPFALAFGLSTPETGEDGPTEIIGEPITRVARMTSDLDGRLVGTAIVDGDEQEVQIHADPSIPRSLRGRQVLVFYSNLFQQWRLLNTDIGVLSPRM